ncbi:hypothetical protein CYMTET_9361 [Cymbomonas tetramitiformis]|uniref:Uncharacterized protein n=1 Tax=Cymbomonas tetramitiformis TaxID=36881 RepID=A0AAE0GR87_9CHLO|nr:hypothetical protein CYMTET_9361 [Cymbomonas tetramitiformis]
MLRRKRPRTFYPTEYRNADGHCGHFVSGKNIVSDDTAPPPVPSMSMGALTAAPVQRGQRPAPSIPPPVPAVQVTPPVSVVQLATALGEATQYRVASLFEGMRVETLPLGATQHNPAGFCAMHVVDSDSDEHTIR